MNCILNLKSFGILVENVSESMKSLALYFKHKIRANRLFSSKNLIELQSNNESTRKNIIKVDKHVDSEEKKYNVELLKSLNFNLANLATRIQAINCSILEMSSPGTGNKIAVTYGINSIIYKYMKTMKYEKLGLKIINPALKNAEQKMLHIQFGFEKLDLFEYFHKTPMELDVVLPALKGLQTALDNLDTSISLFLTE